MVLLAALLALVATACGAGEDFAPSATGGPNVTHGGGYGSGPYSTGECSPNGATRPCDVTLGVNGETVLCIDGEQLCVDGNWSDCKQTSMKARHLKKGAFAEIGLGQDAKLSDFYDPSGQPKFTPLSLDAGAAPCLSPCSPTCQDFAETPSFTLTGKPITSGNVTAGSIANVPSGLLTKAYVASGCTQAYDCQFGYYCSDPVSGASCAHSVCATGSYLGSSCDPDTSGVGTGNASVTACVQQICANSATAYCCEPSGVSMTGTVDITQSSLYYQNSAHHGSLDGHTLQLNVNGAGTTTLTFTAANCASEATLLAAIRAQWPALTVTQGGPTGKDLVLDEASGTIVLTTSTGSTTLGLANPAVTNSSTGWDAGCVQATHDICGGYCMAPNGTCSHNKCYTGDPLTSGCSTCVTSICAAHPECCGSGGGTWTSACVGYIATLCSASSQCPSARGACLPWATGQTDPSCPGVDLTIGVPCTNPANYIPVCNIGTQATNGASFSIVGFASNSGSIPALPPSCGSNGCLKHVCVVASGTVIPAGGCVNVPCDTPQGGPFGQNEQLYVNPPQVIAAGNGTTTTLTTAQIPECDGQNNWSIAAGGACVTTNCTPITGTLASTALSSCSFGLPGNPGTAWDESNPVVQITPSGSTAKSVPFVSGPSACGLTTGGFYYDDSQTPANIVFCPASCTAATTAGATTSYTLSCPVTYTAGTIPLQPFSAPFTGVSACPSGTRPQWDYLGYDAITPGPSNITFQAQTGPTSTTFDNPLVLLATAQSAPTDTQYCPLGALPSAGGSCPVNVFNALNMGSPNGPAQETYLNLVITLNPAQTVGPTLNTFQLTYSCPSSE